MKKIFVFTPILLIVLILATTSTGQEANWGLNPGDTFVYKITEIKFSGTGDSNLALLLDEVNRTSIIIIEEVSSHNLVYAMSTINATNIITNQSINLESFDIIPGSSIVLPTGNFPIAIPLSTDKQENYPEYLHSTSVALNLMLNELLNSFTNSSYPSEINISSKLDKLLIINSSMEIQNATEIVSGIFGNMDDLNFTFYPGMENVSFGNIEVSLELAYNLTDGSMEYVQINVSELTTSTDNIDIPISVFVRIKKESKFSIEELKERAEDASFDGWILGIISFTILYRIKNKRFYKIK